MTSSEQRQGAPGSERGDGPPPRPTWVKTFIAVLLVIVVALVVMAFAGSGEHGPGRHVPAGELGEHTSPVQPDS